MDEIKYAIKHYFHLPSILFIHMINLYCKIILRFDLKYIDTLVSLENTNIPTLFIHGLNDDFVLPSNSKINYEKYKYDKDLLLVKNASHGMSYLVDKEKYLEKIKINVEKYIK